MNAQRGFLLVLAAFLIVVGATVAVAVSELLANEGGSLVSDVETTQAFYVANAGLHRAIYRLTSHDLTMLLACSDISGHADFTGVSFGEGEFTVTAAQSSATTTLGASISSGASVIPVASLASLTSAGQVYVDSEQINYTGTSTSSVTCSGNAPCLTGATRGVSGSIASTHSSGVTVGQSVCTLTSSGAVVGLYGTATRVLTDEVFSLGSGSADGFAVGNNNSYETILLKLAGMWNRASASSAIPNKHLYGLFMLNPFEGWAVGQRSGGKGVTLHWDGTQWTYVAPSSGTPNKDLNDVFCASQKDCWAVGDRKTFLHWNGQAWSNGAVDSSVPNKNIEAVYCNATNDCWAVGQKEGGDALLAKWDGLSWDRISPVSSAPNKNLYGVSCASSDDCWAAGQSETFLHWNGVSWSNGSKDSSVPNKNFYATVCPGSNACWAVGVKQGGDALITFWNGSYWSRVLPDATVPNNNLYGLYCSSASSCWASGDSGTIIYWDGSTWTDASAGTIPSTRISEVEVLGSSSGATPFVDNWREV